MKHHFRFVGIATTAAMIVAARRAESQAVPDSVRLTLGDAARAAAEHSAAAEVARGRIDEARARVRQAQSALLPNVTGDVLQSGRTFNTVTFGITFPGNPPLFNPNGQVEGPVNTIDLRGH